MSDLIDRQRLKDDIAVLFERNEKLIDEWLANCVDDVIDEQPSADVPDRKVGEWVCHGVEEGHLIEKYTCSECDYYSGTRTSRFCPNCGARMKGEDDDSDRT